jgi:hypothetical protein
MHQHPKEAAQVENGIPLQFAYVPRRVVSLS